MREAALVSISESARLYGKSRKWVYDQIQKYGISTHKSPDENERRFQLVDLIAHKGEPKSIGTPVTVKGDTVEVRTLTPEVTPTVTALLKQENEFLRKENQRLEGDIEERREREEQLRKQVDRLLLPKPEEAQPAPSEKAQSLSWVNATLIGCGAVITIILVFVAWVLPHLG